MKETKIDKAYVEDRTVSVPNIRSEQDERVIHEYLDDMAGMFDIEVDHERKSVRVVYDSSQIGFDQIERVLTTVGYPLSHTFWSRMKVSMYRFMDDNAHSNANSTVGACCSRPRGIYTKGHR